MPHNVNSNFSVKAMSLNFEEIKLIDQKTRNIVFGFIRNSQSLLPKSQTYYNIPPIVYHCCLLFFWLKIIPISFSNKYKSNYNIIKLIDNNKAIQKSYVNVDKYPYIALDIEPMSDGIHCFRITINGKNDWAIIGIHCDIKNASKDYYDLKCM